MIEKRQFIRYTTGAKVRINMYSQALILPRDVRRHGCCTFYPDTPAASGIDPEKHHEYTLEIFPEPGAVERFKLIIRPRWTKIKNGMRDTGCLIVQFPAREDSEHFTAYLARRVCGK
jgi:hypothetical protein